MQIYKIECWLVHYWAKDRPKLADDRLKQKTEKKKIHFLQSIAISVLSVLIFTGGSTNGQDFMLFSVFSSMAIKNFKMSTIVFIFYFSSTHQKLVFVQTEDCSRTVLECTWTYRYRQILTNTDFTNNSMNFLQLSDLSFPFYQVTATIH